MYSTSHKRVLIVWLTKQYDRSTRTTAHKQACTLRDEVLQLTERIYSVERLLPGKDKERPLAGNIPLGEQAEGALAELDLGRLFVGHGQLLLWVAEDSEQREQKQASLINSLYFATHLGYNLWYESGSRPSTSMFWELGLTIRKNAYMMARIYYRLQHNKLTLYMEEKAK